MVKWSTNENRKLLPLVEPLQVHAGDGGGQVMMDAPCRHCCLCDQKNSRGNPSPHSLLSNIIDKQMCAGHLQAKKIASTKLPLE